MKRQTSHTPLTLVTTSSDNRVELTRFDFHDDLLLISQENPCINGVYLSGGPFYVKKRRFRPFIAPELHWWVNSSSRYHTPYIGTLTSIPNTPETVFDVNAQVLSHRAAAYGFGATGWKRARPGNPVAGISTFVGELRDLPRLPLRLLARLRRFRALGSEYLNVVFGWVPFVSEVRKMYVAYRTMDRHLAQIVRNNGRGIKRSRIIRDDHSTTVSEVGSDIYPWVGWSNTPPNWSDGGSSYVTTETEVIDKIWFEGQFRYYIPDIGSSEWTRKATRALFGVNITPEVMWDLLPWSWLVDYFGNVGDVMSNMSSNAVENLTADYAYIMRTVETRTRVSGFSQNPRKWTGGTRIGSKIPEGRVHGTAVNETVTKMRFAASPYGFGINYNGLSAYQVGVLAALGISRSKF